MSQISKEITIQQERAFIFNGKIIRDTPLVGGPKIRFRRVEKAITVYDLIEEGTGRQSPGFAHASYLVNAQYDEFSKIIDKDMVFIFPGTVVEDNHLKLWIPAIFPGESGYGHNPRCYIGWMDNNELLSHECYIAEFGI